MQQIDSCPICRAKVFNPFLICKDFTVSRETFALVECQNCDFKFTNPIPDLDKLSGYYQSEDYVSHSGTKKGVINFLYHKVRSRTLKQKLNLVNRLVKNNPKKILDFGCGTGEFLNTCKENGWDTFGLEEDEKTRSYAADNYSLGVKNPKELCSIENDSFSVVSLWHVLEHLPNLNDDFSNFVRVLKKGGALIVAVPNPSSYDAKHYREFWAGYDVPRHLYHFEPKNIKTLFKKHGLAISETLPMKYDSFYVSMLSEKYKGGNFIKGVLNGLKSNLKAKKTGEQYSSQIYIAFK